MVKLNLRWFNEKTRQVLLDGIKRINEGIAVANGLPADAYPKITMKGNVNPLVNDTELTAKVNRTLVEVLGVSNVRVDIPSSMGSEDFQHLITAGQSATYDYIKVGTAHPDLHAQALKEGKRAPYFNHNGNYQVDLKAIPLGTVIGASGLLALFQK